LSRFGDRTGNRTIGRSPVPEAAEGLSRPDAARRYNAHADR